MGSRDKELDSRVVGNGFNKTSSSIPSMVKISIFRCTFHLPHLSAGSKVAFSQKDSLPRGDSFESRTADCSV